MYYNNLNNIEFDNLNQIFNKLKLYNGTIICMYNYYYPELMYVSYNTIELKLNHLKINLQFDYENDQINIYFIMNNETIYIQHIQTYKLFFMYQKHIDMEKYNFEFRILQEFMFEILNK